MTTKLVSAASRRPLPVAATGHRVALAARAAAQHAGRAPAVLDRVTEAGGTAPSASAFQSAL
ncbi:hypothetical protein ACFYZ9_07445 [Streptomyces sp. NPDC001691]|uniref:hypothetical protein n=1 Tax=unclassified Streptomyces TaxID=2593676 RepID=UPI000DE99B17|nr:hypothetical protein [Streptomyces sp. SDr-06]RCH68747.1 hypothetical protein DT019_08740 [Streptomyces sp. SDr-06]